MFNRELELLAHFKRIRVNWQTSNSVMAKELRDLMLNETPIAPEHLGNPHSCPLSETQQIRFIETIKEEQEFWNK